MTLTIRAGETQRSFVERVLQEQGRISAHEAMFDLRDTDGHPKSITRLAAVIDTLRRSGWDIPPATTAPGQQAVYVLRGRAFAGTPVGRTRECPSCHRPHPVGTRCVREGVPA
jgi:hypothetical protein